MANLKGLKIGSIIIHTDNAEENFGKVFKATIIGYDRLAIQVKSDTGAIYFINTWDII